MGHEICSLGVHLLEIGLWELVIVQRDDGFHLSAMSIDKAIQHGYAQEHDRDRSERFIDAQHDETVFLGLADSAISLQIGPIFV